MIDKNLSAEPLVSIVTPSYNQGHFIEDTILSVKLQSYHNIEHLIIDGGSTDSTLDILKRYTGTYNMHWISEPDEGQADAVNKGFSLCNGDIIGWLNSDDVYLTIDAISFIVNAFITFPNVDIVYGNVVTIDANNRIRRVRCLPNFSYGKLLRLCYFAQPAVFFRASVVKEYELDTSFQFSMDYEFWLRLGREFKFFHLNRILAADRNHYDRKILRQRRDSLLESRRVKIQYGQTFGARYMLARLFDKVMAGYLRARGLASMVSLRFKSNQKFAIELVQRNLLVSLVDQLVGKNLSKL